MALTGLTPDFSNDGGALGCSAIEGETVAARYFIRNDSTDDVSGPAR
jgi:hypothetical protein